MSHIGLKATQTIDREDVKRYVICLSSLAICVIIGRILWIIDMIIQAKIGIRKELAKEEEEEENGDTGGDKNDDPYAVNDDYYGGSRKMNPSTLLFYFSVQVVIMALVYSTMWAFCVTRALRFQTAVDESSDRPQASITV